MSTLWKSPAGDEIAAINTVAELKRLLLSHRSVTPETEGDFFHDVTLSDPSTLENIEEAYALLDMAVSESWPIAIYGDYDADGISSSAVLSALLKSKGVNARIYIPNRLKEGYGLNEAAVRLLADEGIKLLITVDTGIASSREIKLARELGMQVMVLDHHEIPAVRPEAVILHPFLNKTYEPWAAAGLTYQFVRYVADKWQSGFEPERYLDLVAVATVADIVPLIGDNRKIVKLGLSKMRRDPHPALKALLDLAEIASEDVDCWHLGFVLGPRINAAGRMTDAKIALDLLATPEAVDLTATAAELSDINLERQVLTENLLASANIVAEGQIKAGHKIIIVAGDYSIGVAGIVASKLTELFHLPAIVGELTDGVVKASARSISGINLVELFNGIADDLIGYGGHAMAAGLRFEFDKLSMIQTKLTEEILSKKQDALNKFLVVEALLDDLDLKEVFMMTNDFEPFGMSNARPTFAIRNFRWHNLKLTRDGKHARGDIGFGGNYHSVIGFGLGNKLGEITRANELAVKLKKDTYYPEGFSLQLVDYR